MLTDETKVEIKKRLLEKFELKKIIIFGSQARGTADNRSDIDLLIVSQEIPDRYKLMREIRRSLLPMDFAFDIIAVTPEEYNRDKFIPGTIARYASKEGIIIYES